MELPLTDDVDLAELDDELQSVARPPLRVGPSPRGFVVGLHLEHLEEASFLYDQRCALLGDREVAWPELHAFEDRMEAHLDALALGGALALDVCRQQLRIGDHGEAHGALRVACRARRWDLVEFCVQTTEPDDTERWMAMKDALSLEAPTEWSEGLGSLAMAGGPAGTVAASVIGHRRLPAAPALLRALDTMPIDDSREHIRALGRLKYRPAVALLLSRHLRAALEPIREEAAVACVRMGETNVATFVQTQPGAWAITTVALAGGPSAARRMLDGSTIAVDDTRLRSLGILGDIAAVPSLLFHLNDESTAEAAALALHLITGAELFEETTVPVEADDWDIEVEELEGEEGDVTYQVTEVNPESSESEPGRPRLSQDPASWSEWWENHARDFQEGVRYRLGLPATPAAILGTVRAEHLPRSIRQLAAEELAIRYACDVPFETDFLVREQLAALGAMDAWAESASFTPGAWYLSGRRLNV